MAKLRLALWTVALAVAAMVLLRSTSWPGAGDPAATVMAGVRVLAGALAAYLCAATVLATRLPRLAPIFVRRLVASAISGGLLLSPAVAGAEPARPAPVEAPVLHLVSPATTAVAAATPSGLTGAPSPTGVEEVTIVAGDHLWAVAERTLAARLGRAPSDAEIVPFWTRLIDVNRDRLVGGDPDLVFPGQRFVLPS